jgi:hypothetical protein
VSPPVPVQHQPVFHHRHHADPPRYQCCFSARTSLPNCSAGRLVLSQEFKSFRGKRTGVASGVMSKAHWPLWQNYVHYFKSERYKEKRGGAPSCASLLTVIWWCQLWVCCNNKAKLDLRVFLALHLLFGA